MERFKKCVLIFFTIFCCLMMCSCPDGPIAPGEDDGTGDESGDQSGDGPETGTENDFALIADSGTMSLSISGLTSGETNTFGMTIFYGATGILEGGDERIGDSFAVANDTETRLFSDEGFTFNFTGGSIIPYLGCVIDADNSGDMNNGDYIGGVTDVVTAAGKIINLSFPDDFDMISDSSAIDLNISGLTAGSPDFTDFILYYGATGIPSGQLERIGTQETISENAVSLVFNDGESDFIFTGGDVIPYMGCFIDINDNGIPDDGDYIGGEYDVVAGSDVSVDLGFPLDFTLISGSGKITLSLSGLSPQIGKQLMFGANGISTGKFERIGHSATINSDSMNITLQMEGTDFIFTGGSNVRTAGCIIDINDNGRADDGDYVAGAYNITVNGDMTIPLKYNP